MIPTAIPNVGELEERNLRQCISSTMVSTVGPFVTEFEERLAAISGTPGAVSTSAGTCALHAALTEVGAGHGDLVILPSFTFIASANAISHTGARPWLLDCSGEDWTLDLDLLAACLARETRRGPDGEVVHVRSGRRVRAIMPVMTMGLPLDFVALARIADEYGLPVVVDAAAAIGSAALHDAPVAAICFSFNGNKTITCGGGGAIVSRSPERLAALRHLTTTGRKGLNYDHDIVAFNYRMTNVCAAIGVAQLERLDGFLEAKARIAARYAGFAARHPVLDPFPGGSGGESVHWFSGFYYRGEDRGTADAFRTHMREAGIDLREFWKPVHMQVPYAGCHHTPMPVTEDLWWRVFPLPCSTHLSEADQTRVIDAAEMFWSVR